MIIWTGTSNLPTIMWKMSFGARWVSWIMWYISTTSFLVIINRTLEGDMGSPISLLFVIVMELMSSLIMRVRLRGFPSSWKLGGRGGEGDETSHFLFVGWNFSFLWAWRRLTDSSLLDSHVVQSSLWIEGEHGEMWDHLDWRVDDIDIWLWLLDVGWVGYCFV